MKRFLSLLLTVVMVIGLCTLTSGCGKGKGGSGDVSDALKGKTIRIASWGNVKPTAGTKIGDMKLEQIVAAEEKFGCVVEYVTITDLTQQLLTAATTGQIVADVIMQRAHRVQDLLLQGEYFWSMEDLGFDPADEIYNTDTKHYTTNNGKTYGFWYDPTEQAQFMVMNKTLLDMAGLEVPYNLVKEKKWNWDAWLNIMQKTTDKTTGINGFTASGTFPMTMMYANETSLYAEKDGKHISNTGDTRLVETFDFTSKCIGSLKVMDYKIGSAATLALENFVGGKCATAIVGTYQIRDTISKKMTGNYGIMPIPMGPSATNYVNGNSECKTFCIQKAVDKEEAIALVQFMNEAFVYPMDMRSGIESYYKSLCADKESLDVMMYLNDNIPLTVYEEYTSPDLRSDSGQILSDLAQMAAGNISAKSTLDSYNNTVKSLLDEYYGQ